MTTLTHPYYPEIILTPSEDGDYYGSVEGVVVGIFTKEPCCTEEIIGDPVEDPENCKVIQHFTNWDYECQIELDKSYWSQYDSNNEELVLFDDNGDKIPF